MSKITIIVDVDTTGYTDKEQTKIASTEDSNKILKFSEILEHFGFNKATILPTRKAISSYLKLRIVTMRADGHCGHDWEVGMSDLAYGDDILNYDDAMQRSILEGDYYYSQHCYVCGNPLPTVDSYLPQGGINQNVRDMLAFLGVSNIAEPTARYGVDDLIAQYNQGGDMVVYVNTHDMPTCGWNTRYDPAWLQALTDFCQHVQATGGQLVRLNEL